MSEQGKVGYTYADLYVGMSFRSPGRTITDADLVSFSGLTGDYSELHTSDVYAKSSQFGRRVAHGMLGLAYAHGLMWARTGELRETAIAFLGINDWKFVGPIFVGDTMFVNYRIAELRDSKSKPTQAIAIFDVEVVTHDDRIVQRGRKALLVSKVPLTAVRGIEMTDGNESGRSGVAIRISRVSKIFGEDGDHPFQALKQVTIDIDAGEFVSVVGPSGCGKSTLMLMVAGLLNRSAWRDRDWRQSRQGPDHRCRYRVPGSPPARISHGARQRHAACGHPQAAAQASRGSGEGAICPASSNRSDGQVSAAAIGRHAPARLPHPHACARSAAAPHGRAIWRSGCVDAASSSNRPGGTLAAPQADGALHHP